LGGQYPLDHVPIEYILVILDDKAAHSHMFLLTMSYVIDHVAIETYLIAFVLYAFNETSQCPTDLVEL